MSSMSDVVSAVISEDSWTQGRFRINPYTNDLQYKIEDDYVITIDNQSDKRRAAKGSDLLSQLKLRNYHLLESKGITSEGELGFVSEYDEDGCATKIEPIVSVIDKTEVAKISSEFSELRNAEVGYIPVNYIDDGSGDYSIPEDYKITDGYYNFRIIKGFPNDDEVIDLVGLNGLIYTDIINLGGIESIDFTKEVSVVMTVQYSIRGSDVVSTEDLKFNASDDLSATISNNIEVEYYNKCIRLLPLSDKVAECIIAKCSVIVHE